MATEPTRHHGKNMADKNVRPSERMIKTAELVAKGMPARRAMEKAGYSKATAKNPKNVTSQKSWGVLLDEFLPQSRLAEVHRELLDKKEVTFKRKGKKYVMLTQPHTDVKGALDMGYKLRGSYQPEKVEVSGGVKYNLKDEDRARLDRILAKNKKK